MKNLTKLRKISDDLYVEDYEREDGSKREFKYEREFEALNFDLFDAQVIFSSEVNLKETQWDGRKLFRITGEDIREDNRADTVGSAASITAKCGKFNGSITVLDHDKPLTIHRVSSVTMGVRWEKGGGPNLPRHP